ncbi:MAG: 16S rRNA (uracil(1498)-N(3))-methyltransferase [Magnetococcales bacterium]|nr:16S rRNA (uracil(1498)-N(3))-methyltransferase [Magnetococcales bacterium]
MIPRLYIPQGVRPGERIALHETERHRLTRTLRLRVGDPVQVFHESGGEWRAVIRDAGPPMELEVLEHLSDGRESPLRVTLVLGLTKSGAIEVAVQKAVEAGADTLIPLLTRYGVSRPDPQQAENKLRRLQRIAVEAAQQCGRTLVPVLHPLVGWPQLAPLLPEGPRLLFWEHAGQEGARMSELPPPQERVTLLIGPEGGLTSEEVRFAQEALHFQLVTLGPRILRAETAALVATAACQLLWGDMG